MRIDRTDYEHAIPVQIGNVAAAKVRLVQAAADGARALGSAAEAQLKVAQDEAQY